MDGCDWLGKGGCDLMIIMILCGGISCVMLLLASDKWRIIWANGLWAQVMGACNVGFCGAQLVEYMWGPGWGLVF